MAEAMTSSVTDAPRSTFISARLAATVFAAFIGAAAMIPPSAIADDKAHAIADQFSGASSNSASRDRKPPAADPLKSYEDEMLARAREEAQARAKADLAAAEAQAARERADAAASATKIADQAKAEAQAKARAELQAKSSASADEEARNLSERLRATREAHEAKQAAEREAAAAAQRAALEADARSAALAAAEASKREAALAVARARLAERSRRLGGKVETARTARLASEAAARAQSEQQERITRVAARVEANAAEATDGTVTVLIVMDAGARGIRRWNKTADPMLCVDETCYISRGAGTAAKRIDRSKAFGPSVALGERAGDCRNKLVCAFRGVTLEKGRSWMQPIDLRIMRHDRREAKLVVADPTCAVTAGKLVCTRTVTSADYRAWIVPEPMAERAGAKAIEAALVAELPPR